jgi:uncharacterized peroxidase-related enzyme
MPFFRSMPDDAGPGNVFTTYPEIYALWSQMSQELMNGPSPLSPGEREMIAAFVVGTAGCDFAFIAHSEAAYAWGIEDGLIDALVDDLETAPVEPRFKPLLKFARKLTLTPGEMTEADADAVFAAGWDEKALHDTIAVTARMNFMQRLVEGYGFTPMSRENARQNAQKRVEHGYVNLYPEFAKRAKP